MLFKDENKPVTNTSCGSQTVIKTLLTILFKPEKTSKRCLACNTSKSEPNQNKNMYENE